MIYQVGDIVELVRYARLITDDFTSVEDNQIWINKHHLGNKYKVVMTHEDYVSVSGEFSTALWHEEIALLKSVEDVEDATI